MPRLSIRVDLGPGLRIGPGKVALLETIEATGSISAAGRALGMSYRRAWLLVEELNRTFALPVVSTQTGGGRGGGTSLTAHGRELIARYRRLEREAEELAARHLGPLAVREPEPQSLATMTSDALTTA
jgi:molybdate transport system regulatory protein